MGNSELFHNESKAIEQKAFSIKIYFFKKKNVFLHHKRKISV